MHWLVGWLVSSIVGSFVHSFVRLFVQLFVHFHENCVQLSLSATPRHRMERMGQVCTGDYCFFSFISLVNMHKCEILPRTFILILIDCVNFFRPLHFLLIEIERLRATFLFFDFVFVAPLRNCYCLWVCARPLAATLMKLF